MRKLNEQEQFCLDIFCPLSDEETKVIFFGAIYPYSTADPLTIAKQCGF